MVCLKTYTLKEDYLFIFLVVGLTSRLAEPVREQNHLGTVWPLALRRDRFISAVNNKLSRIHIPSTVHSSLTLHLVRSCLFLPFRRICLRSPGSLQKGEKTSYAQKQQN